MNKEDLLRKELSNLYALNKQVNQYFNGSEIGFLSENSQQNVMEYVKLVCQNEEQVSNALSSLDFNPTNTTDSIVQEITENLGRIAGKEIGDEVKEAGYLMSVNRLICYHLANIENIKFVGRQEKRIAELAGLSDDLSQLRKRLFAQ